MRTPTSSQELADRTHELCVQLAHARQGVFTDVVRALTMGLPRMLGPLRWTGTYLVVPGGRLRRLAGIGAGDLLPRLSERAMLLGVTDLAQPVAVPAAGKQGSMGSVPITEGDTVFGLLVVERAPGGPTIERHELVALRQVAEQVSKLLRREHHVSAEPTPIPVPIPSRPVPPPVSALASATPPGGHPALTTTTPLPDAPVAFVRPPLSNGTAPRGRLSRTQVEEIRRVEDDLRMARKIQQRFLPELPRFWQSATDTSGLLIAAEYRPAFEVGGDFYDLINVAPHRFVAIIGDVSGKGVSAALIMTRAMVEFRLLAEQGRSPGDILLAMNRTLLDRGLDDAFVTAACVSVDTQRNEMVIANAGHIPPLVRDGAGAIRILELESGVPLGMWSVEAYPEHLVPFLENEVLLLMTDGVTEALDPMPQPTTNSNLGRIVAAAPTNVHDLVRTLLGAVDGQVDRTRRDDVAVLGLQLGRV